MTSPPRPQPPWRTTLLPAVLLGVAFFVVYALLRQGCFYKHDGWLFVADMQTGVPSVSNHYLYLPLAVRWAQVWSWLGVDAFAAAGLLSAAGVAVAVALTFAAARIDGQDGKTATLVAALVGTCPAVAFFATVVEVHGPFLAFAGLSFLASVLLARRPGLGPAVSLGVAMALARGMHASGLLLATLLLPWVVWRARQRDRALGWARAILLVAVSGGVLLVASYGLGALVRALGGEIPPGSALDLLLAVEGFRPSIQSALTVTWREWLYPFLPLSALALIALTFRRLVVPALLLHLGLLPYLVVALLILVGIPEYGAYLLPLVFPAGLLAVSLLEPRCCHGLGRRLAVGLVLVSAALGGWQIARHEAARGVDAGYAHDAIRAAGAEPAWFLVWEDWEMDSLLLHRSSPACEPRFLPNLTLLPPAEQERMLPAYAALLAGRRIVLTDIAEKALADTGRSPSGPVLLAFLLRSYRLQPIAAGSFRGKLLMPLP